MGDSTKDGLHSIELSEFTKEPPSVKIIGINHESQLLSLYVYA